MVICIFIFVQGQSQIRRNPPKRTLLSLIKAEAEESASEKVLTIDNTQDRS